MLDVRRRNVLDTSYSVRFGAKNFTRASLATPPCSVQVSNLFKQLFGEANFEADIECRVEAF